MDGPLDGTRRAARFLGPLLGVALLAGTSPGQDATTRVSLRSNGVEGNKPSGVISSTLSSDGRFAAFESSATNLVAGDGNGLVDVFVHDRTDGRTFRVSVDSAGVEGDGDSLWPSLSSDGRFVAFESLAANLVAGDGNGVADLFVHDRDPDGNGTFDEGNGVTIRVSVTNAGGEADGASHTPSISGDGTLVAFASDATNLVTVDTNGDTDVFVRDLVGLRTTRHSLSTSGTGGNDDSTLPVISSDGAFLAFVSLATNLVTGDTNGDADIFLRDRVNRITTRVSVSSGGAAGNDASFGPPAISSTGSVVAFASNATNLVTGDSNGDTDVFVHDVAAATTTRVSVDSSGAQVDGASLAPALSADAAIVAFQSVAATLVPQDGNGAADAFVHDRTTGATTCASINCAGGEGNGASVAPALSGDGLLVGFASVADDLVVLDDNGDSDVFVHDRTASEPEASWSNYGVGFPGTNGIPALFASGDPEFGATISVHVTNSSNYFLVGFLFLGFDDASIPTGDGGTLLVDHVFIFPLAISPGGLQLPIEIPRLPELCGFSAFMQVLELDPGAQFGVSFTPGLELAFGQ